MRVALILAALGSLLLALIGTVQAASVNIAWDQATGAGGHLTGFQVTRCTVPTGQTVCTPNTDLQAGVVAPTVRTFTDTTAAPGASYCWTVWGLYEGGPRIGPGTTDAQVPYVCKTASPLPLAAPTNLRVMP
jgi:hypothetical protein